MTSRSAPGAAAAALAVLAVAVSLGACGANDGGETRCRDFALMSDGDRAAVVEKLLGGDPSDGTVNLTVTAANYHCLAPENSDDLVKDILG